MYLQELVLRMESDPDTLADLLDFLANASPIQDETTVEGLATPPPLQRQDAIIESRPSGVGDREPPQKSVPTAVVEEKKKKKSATTNDDHKKKKKKQGTDAKQQQPPIEKKKKVAEPGTATSLEKDGQTSAAKPVAKKRPLSGEEIRATGATGTPAVKKRRRTSIEGKKQLERRQRRLQKIKLPILPTTTCSTDGSDDSDDGDDSEVKHPYFLTRLPLVTFYQCGACLRKSNASYSLINPPEKNAERATVKLHFCQRCRNVNAQLTKALAYHVAC